METEQFNVGDEITYSDYCLKSISSGRIGMVKERKWKITQGKGSSFKASLIHHHPDDDEKYFYKNITLNEYSLMYYKKVNSSFSPPGHPLTRMFKI